MTNATSSSVESKPTAYAYSRFSTIQQQDGDSKRRQESLARAWPESVNYRIEYLHDAGISAYCGKNRTIGQFGLFLASLRGGQLGPRPVLLVENLDRISREELETAQSLFLEIISHGATIITLHNGKRYAKGMGLVDIITALVEMDVAHQHSAKLSMRVRAAVAARKQSGGIIHNRASAPGWLRLDPKRTKFEPIPERVALVRRMFEMAAKGLGPDAIARVLNTENVPSWSTRKTGLRAWRGEAVSSILYGRSVLGEFEGRAGYFGEAVIPLELWSQVNDRTKKAAQGRGKGVVREENLLCGVVVSGIDGSKMIYRKSGVKDRKTREYVWHSYLVSNATIAGVSNHRARYGEVEQRLLWLFGNLDPDMLTRARAGVRDDTQDRLEAAQRKMAEAAKQVAKYRKLIELDPDPSASLVLDLKRHETALREAESALAEAKSHAAKAAAVPEVVADLEKPENRRAMRAEIAQWCQSIELFRDEFIVWFSANNGLRVNLRGEPKILVHHREEEAGFDFAAAVDAVSEDLAAVA